MWYNSEFLLCAANFTEVWLKYVVRVMFCKFCCGVGWGTVHTRSTKSIFSCHLCPTMGSVSLAYSRQHISVRHGAIWAGMEHLSLFRVSAVGCVSDRVTTKTRHSPIKSAKKKTKQEKETLIKNRNTNRTERKFNFCIKLIT